MADTTTTRRALLGATFAAPVAATILTTPAAAGQGLFAARLAEYHRCCAVHEAWHKANMTPACAAHDAMKAGTDEWQATLKRVFELEGEVGEYVDRTSDALDKLLVTPAPDYAALAVKLEIALQEDVFNLRDDYSEFGAVLLADVRRLGREG